MQSRTVHRIKVRGRLFIALPAGEEDDAREIGGYGRLQHTDGIVRHFFDGRLLCRLFARYDHARLEDSAFGSNALMV